MLRVISHTHTHAHTVLTRTYDSCHRAALRLLASHMCGVAARPARMRIYGLVILINYRYQRLLRSPQQERLCCIRDVTLPQRCRRVAPQTPHPTTCALVSRVSRLSASHLGPGVPGLFLAESGRRCTLIAALHHAPSVGMCWRVWLQRSWNSGSLSSDCARACVSARMRVLV